MKKYIQRENKKKKVEEVINKLILGDIPSMISIASFAKEYGGFSITIIVDETPEFKKEVIDDTEEILLDYFKIDPDNGQVYRARDVAQHIYDVSGVELSIHKIGRVMKKLEVKRVHESKIHTPTPNTRKKGYQLTPINKDS